MAKKLVYYSVSVVLTAHCTFADAGGFSGENNLGNKTSTKTESQGFVEAVTGVHPNDLDILKDAHVRVGGAIAAGVTYNPDDPIDRSNFPLTFNDRSNDFQFNRFRVFAQRDTDTSGTGWDIGGRFDFIVGADARFATSLGLDNNFSTDNRFIKTAIPQTYVEVFAPYGNGITAQIGHFFTNIGSMSPVYSLSYSAYSEPSTHTGVLL